LRSAAAISTDPIAASLAIGAETISGVDGASAAIATVIGVSGGVDVVVGAASSTSAGDDHGELLKIDAGGAAASTVDSSGAAETAATDEDAENVTGGN
jgi:hypothetical protein